MDLKYSEVKLCDVRNFLKNASAKLKKSESEESRKDGRKKEGREGGKVEKKKKEQTKYESKYGKMLTIIEFSGWVYGVIILCFHFEVWLKHNKKFFVYVCVCLKKITLDIWRVGWRGQNKNWE